MTNPSPSEHLDYGVPKPITPQPAVDPGTILVCALIAALLAIALLIAPRAENVFRDFGAKIPAPTVLLFILGRATIASGGKLIVLAVFFCAVPVAISIPLQRTGRRILRAVLYLVLLAMILWITLALILPYLNLVQTVSTSPPKKGG